MSILYNKYYTSFGTKQVVNKVNSSRTVSQRWQENILQAPEGIKSLTLIFRSDLSIKVQLFKSTWAFNSHFNFRELDAQNLWGSRFRNLKVKGIWVIKARFLKKYLGT